MLVLRACFLVTSAGIGAGQALVQRDAAVEDTAKGVWGAGLCAGEDHRCYASVEDTEKDVSSAGKALVLTSGDDLQGK